MLKLFGNFCFENKNWGRSKNSRKLQSWRKLSPSWEAERCAWQMPIAFEGSVSTSTHREVVPCSCAGKKPWDAWCGGGKHVGGVGLAQLTEMWKLLKVRFYIVHLKLIRCLVLGTLKIEWFTRKSSPKRPFRAFLLAVCISGNLEAGAWQWLWPCYHLLLLYVRDWYEDATWGSLKLNLFKGSRAPTFPQKPNILLFGIVGAIVLMTFTTKFQR